MRKREKKVTPAHLLIVSILAIFTAEYIIMFALPFLPPLPAWMTQLADSFTLSLIVFPAIYFFSYRPQAKALLENERAMKEIREKEIKYETLATASPDCIKLFDTEGKITYMNHSRLHPECRYNKHTKQWDGYLDSLAEDDRNKFNEAIKSALEGKTSVIEIKHVRGFIREVCMEVMAPLKDALGNIIGIFGVSRDITEYKKLEKTKIGLTQMITHDLNNPLTATSGNLQLLEMELKDTLTQEQVMKFRIALDGLDEIKTMIHNLMEVSLMEENKMALKKKRLNLYTHAQKVKNMMQYVASEGKNITVDLAPDMPEISVDEEILTRIISNLIRNAIKFSPPNTTIEVRIAYKEKGKEFLFAVKDFGIGIPKEYHDKIFDKYIRVDNDLTRTVEGKGLGLTFCKMAVENHKGRIWVESQPEKGSTFCFTIPA